MRLIGICCALAFASVCCGGTFGTTDPRPRITGPKASLGVDLENDLAWYVKACGLLPKAANASAIPTDLYDQKPIPLNAYALAFDKDSTTRLFRHVFRRQDFAQGAPTALDSDHALPLALFAEDRGLPIPTPTQDRSNIGYTESCTSLLAAAVKAGIKLPVASVQSAFEAEQALHATMVVVAGAFESPLTAILGSGGARRVELLLHLLALYEQDESYKLGADAYFLSNFEGVVVLFTEEKGRTVKFTLDANAGGAYGIASADFSAKAGFSGESKLKVNSYGTYLTFAGIDATRRDAAALLAANFAQRMHLLPSANAIADQFAGIGRTFGPAEFSPLRENVQSEHWFDIDGIPEWLCQDTWWQLTPKAGVTQALKSFTTNVTRPDPDHNPARCRFKTSGTPSNPIQNTHIAYAFVTRKKIAGTLLTFTVDRELASTAHPLVIPAAAAIPAVWEPDALGNFSLVWNAKVSYVDTDNLLDSSRPIVASPGALSVSCGDGARSVVPGTVGSDYTGHTIAISFRSNTPQQRNEFDETQPQLPCQVSVSLTLPLLTGKTNVSRSVDLRIGWPRPKSTSANQ